MKKIILLVLILILMTGCESTIMYNFDDSIESEVSTKFNLTEYRSFANANYGNDFGDGPEDSIKRSIEHTRNSLIAFLKDNNMYYQEEFYYSDGFNYDAKYTYTYNYDNFKSNFFLNMCFDNFDTYQDTNTYYYKATGNSNCKGTKLVIKSKNRMIDNNSENTNNNEYIWNIKETGNDIYFAISKTNISKPNRVLDYIIYFLITLIIVILGYGGYTTYKKRMNK